MIELLLTLAVGAVAYWLFYAVVHAWGRRSAFKAGEQEVRKQYERGEFET